MELPSRLIPKMAEELPSREPLAKKARVDGPPKAAKGTQQVVIALGEPPAKKVRADGPPKAAKSDVIAPSEKEGGVVSELSQRAFALQAAQYPPSNPTGGSLSATEESEASSEEEDHTEVLRHLGGFLRSHGASRNSKPPVQK